MHANEHQQHLPIAGHIWSPGIASSLNIGDVARLRYRYFAEGGIFRPMPIQGALAPYLGVTGFRNDSYACRGGFGLGRDPKDIHLSCGRAARKG